MTLPRYVTLAASGTTTIDVTADTRDGQSVRVSSELYADSVWITGDGSTPTANASGVARIQPGAWHETVAVTGSAVRVVKILNPTTVTTARVRIDRPRGGR
jgi:hypothetical protein